MKPHLQLIGVSKDLGEFKLEDVNLEVCRGEYFVVLGPSGAGKTILLQVIAGIIKPDKGKIVLSGRDVTFEPPEKRNVGYVPQNYALFPHLTVFDNIAYGLKLRKTPKSVIAERVRKIAEKLEINHLLHRKPRTLSGGEAQRVALARALVVEPEILLLDEPLAAIDPPMRWELRKYLRIINREFSVTVVHVTHDFIEALSLADRIAVLNRGRVEQVGTPDQVFYKPASEFVAKFTRAQNIFKGEAEPLNEHLSKVSVGDVDFTVTGCHKGRVVVMFRPENVVVAKSPQRTSARNELEGIVEEWVVEGPLVCLTVNVKGLPVRAYITRSSFQELGIKQGSKVFLYVKASQIHVMRA